MNKKYIGVHREGWKFFIIFFSISIFSFFVTKFLFVIFVILTFFTLWFFRDPERFSKSEDNQLLSAADGKICFIGHENPPQETEINETMKKVSIFMNVFNVHVNRSPVQGSIEHVVYKKGKFLNASLDKASDKNERSSLVLNTQNGTKIIVVQIAGLIARRILSFISSNEQLDQGERFGLIRFGSRVDIYMPLDAIEKCKVGDRVVAGESILASLK